MSIYGRTTTVRRIQSFCASLIALAALTGCGGDQDDERARSSTSGLTPETGATGPAWASNTDTSTSPNVLVWDRQNWSSTPYLPVATRIDLVQNDACLDDENAGQAGTGTCASPRWLLEPTRVADTYRLRSARDTGKCLELDPAAPTTPRTSFCRGRGDPYFARQVFALPVSSEGERSLENPSTSRCIVDGPGSTVTSAPCELAAPPASHRWTLQVARHPDEHWLYVNEYADPAAPSLYRYGTSGTSAPTAQNLFVALTEPAADTLTIHRSADGRLNACLDENTDCGPIAFYTVRTPIGSQTPNRVPVFEFISTTSSPLRYRYSTQLSVGAGFTRQPEPAFYAYRDQSTSSERVYEVLVTAKNLATELAVTGLPELISMRDPGGVSYASTGSAVMVYSSETESPDREELLHVLGHVFANAILGPLRDDDECLYTVDPALHSSDFHRPRDLLNTGWQPDTCTMREGWVEFFVTQMLPEHTTLPESVGAGRDAIQHTHGRRLFIVQAIALVAFTIFEVAVLFDTHSRLSNAAAPGPRSRKERFDPITTTLKALVASALTPSSELNIETYSNATPTTRAAASEVRAARPDITDPNALTDADFKSELVNNPSSMCQVIDPSDVWTYESCQTQRPILCGSRTNPNSYALTQSTYALFDAVEGCVREYGGEFEPVTNARKRPRIDYGALHSSGSVVPWGTGEARDSGNKRRRLPPARGVESIGSVITALEEEVEDPDYYYLLVHSLNVGAGSCHIVQCVGSESVFVDCGSMGSDEPILNAAGVLAYTQGIQLFEPDTTPAVVVSHPHRDHYNYLQNVFMERRPESVSFGGSPNRYLGAYQAWMTTLRAANVQVNGTVAAPQVWPVALTRIETFPDCGGATLDMVVVNTGGVGGDQISANRSSAVMQLSLPGYFSAVLPGDAIDETEVAAQNRLVQLGFNRNSYTLMALLAASHHGAHASEGHFSNTLPWANYMRPSHLVYSSGDQHLHPRCDIVDRYEGLGWLEMTAAHDIDCGAPPNAWQTRAAQRRHYTTRGSGTVIAGVAIPRPDTEGEPRVIFLRSGL